MIKYGLASILKLFYFFDGIIELVLPSLGRKIKGTKFSGYAPFFLSNINYLYFIFLQFAASDQK